MSGTVPPRLCTCRGDGWVHRTRYHGSATLSLPPTPCVCATGQANAAVVAPTQGVPNNTDLR